MKKYLPERKYPHSHQGGFTLVEIMIVVAIIGLLAAVAIPNLIAATKKARKVGCINNLNTIEGAKGMWALEAQKPDSATPTDAELFGHAKAIREKPECPGGGNYNLGTVSELPTCSIKDHTL